MKKITIIALFLILIACGTVESAPSERTLQNTNGFSFIKDEDTGCQYVMYESWGSGARVAVTPRLDESGKPMCGKD